MSNEKRHHQLVQSKQPWFVLSCKDTYFIRPSKNSLISHCYSFKAKSDLTQSYAIPDGCIDLLFDCTESQTKALVCGTPLKAQVTPFKANHKYFGVRFAAGFIPDKIAIAPKELVNQQFELLEAIPKASAMIDMLVNESDFIKQTDLIAEYFGDSHVSKSSHVSYQAALYIRQKSGNVRLAELESLTGVTARTLQRKFKQDFGLSPKSFCRIIRFQSALFSINHHNDTCFSDLACILGFSDQPHFLREFKRLINATPVQYHHNVNKESYRRRIRYFQP
ncbi:helix-turn-helix domain-containing protein [Marinomonas sp. THO17]|uniref:helix-turn-helix domain-containing protein n=1 Tax=Marinomonas sp. THO17 TaxID=3149048 RepID=UPI00336BD4C4